MNIPPIDDRDPPQIRFNAPWFWPRLEKVLPTTPQAPQVRFDTRDLLEFFWRINAQGVITYDQLKNFKAANLMEREILDFLLNRNGFYLLSNLDRDDDTLSVEDVKIAATLGEDPLLLENRDMEILQDRQLKQKTLPTENRETAQNPQPPSPGETHPNPDIPIPLVELGEFLEALHPQGRVSQEALQQHQPQNSRESAILNMLTSQGLARIIVQTGQDPNLISPDTLAKVATLLYKPRAYANGAITLSPYPPQEIEEPEAVAEISPTPQKHHSVGYNVSGLQEEVRRFEAEELIVFLKKLSPNGAVTPDILARYIPATRREAEISRHLQTIFKRLAALDGQDQILSPEDIEIAAHLADKPDEKAYFFSQRLLSRYYFA